MPRVIAALAYPMRCPALLLPTVIAEFSIATLGFDPCAAAADNRAAGHRHNLHQATARNAPVRNEDPGRLPRAKTARARVSELVLSLKDNEAAATRYLIDIVHFAIGVAAYEAA
jgi:hypothetical protein